MALNIRDGDREPQILASNVNGSGEHEPKGRTVDLIPGVAATNLGKAEDAAHASGDTGVAVLAVRRDTAAVGSGADGDYSTLNVDAAGKAWITGTALEDDAHASGDKGHVMLARRKDTPAVSSGTDGDYSTFDVSAEGGQWAALLATTRGGCETFRSLDLDETEEEVKGTPGTVYGYYFANLSGAIRFLKFYDNTAAGTTVGTTTPKLTLPLPFQTSNVAAGHITFSAPVQFNTGITVAVTTGIDDMDTGAPGANDVVLNVFYK